MMSGEWQDDVEILTDAFPGYQGDDAVSVPGVEFRIYADVNTAVTDLVAGNLDIVNGVPPEQWEETIAQVPNSDQSADSGINYIGFPTYAEPWDNPDLRAALSMAIDREAITQGIFNGLRDPAYNFYAPVIPGYEENVCDEWDYNPDLAAERFEAAGGLDAVGDSLEIWFNEGGGHDLWMDAIITQWEQNLGIPASSVTFQQLPFAEYLELADTQQLTGPFRLGWGASYLHPQYYTVLPLQRTADEGGNNAAFWRSEAFDAAITEALSFTDLDESIPAWQDAMEVACTEVPLAPVFYSQNTYAWNDPVGGVFIDAFGVLDY
jgi:oligopeptide transport system substrate-binding protein